ncbi:lipid A biosynthesis acyltransferase [Caldithrix abyssi DSM 13497]|nr:lysophospholipid acyltransferase family protein [Caldithrix abyssi]EHO43158.1 lipid A biosynthesis acyltransferase [Caldithrix abyssi DSM 13497]
MKTIEYISVKLLFFIFSRISLKSGKRFAGLLTILVEKVIRYRRDVILSNLHLVYGEQLPRPEKQFLHDIYKNFIYLWMEFLQINHFTPRTLDELMRFKNPEVLAQLKRENKGVLFVSGHFGNFEWLGQAMVIQGWPIWAIAKKQSNQKVDQFITQIRSRFGMKIVYTKKAMQVCERALKQKEAVAIAFDQDARKRGVFVNFLGQPSSTAVGTAVLHLRTGADIVLLIALRKDYAKFDVYAKKIELPVKTGNLQDDVTAITQKVSSEFEKWVREYPEQWFWMHRRWKTRPASVSSSSQGVN